MNLRALWLMALVVLFLLRQCKMRRKRSGNIEVTHQKDTGVTGTRCTGCEACGNGSVLKLNHSGLPHHLTSNLRHDPISSVTTVNRIAHSWKKCYDLRAIPQEASCICKHCISIFIAIQQKHQTNNCWLLIFVLIILAAIIPPPDLVHAGTLYPQMTYRTHFPLRTVLFCKRFFHI